ncbi:MAG: hypothetical protein WCO52_03220 [bacterium]
MTQSSLLTSMGRFGTRFVVAASALALGFMGMQSVIATSGPQINTRLAVQLSGGQSEYASSAQATPGDSLAFRVLLENTGDANGAHPKIVEHLDSRLTYTPNSSFVRVKGSDNKDHDYPLSDSYMSIKNNGHDLGWAFVDMAPQPNAALYLQFKARLASDDQFSVGQTTYTNTATSSFDGVSAVTNPVSYTVTRYGTPVTSFSVKNEVRDMSLGYDIWYDAATAIIAPGDKVAYRMTILNTGNTTANNVSLKNVLPAGFTYAGNALLTNQNNTNGTPISGNAIVNGGYVFSSLEPHTGGYQRIQFEAIAPSNCGADVTVVDKAQIVYQGAVKASDDATTLISCTRGLTVVKDVQNPATGAYVDSIGLINPNQTLTYRILVGNTGNTTAVNPTLRDVLPTGATYVPNSLTIDNAVQSQPVQDAFFKGGIILTTFDPGHGKTITLKVQVRCLVAQTTAVNTAFIKANGTGEKSDTATAILPACVIPTPTPAPTPTATPTPTPKPTPTPTPKPTPTATPTPTPKPTPTPTPKPTATPTPTPTATPKPTPTPTPTPSPTPTPTPVPTATPTPTHSPTPSPSPVVVTVPPQLPKTGPEAGLLLAGTTSGLGAGLARYLKLKKALKKSLENLDIR